MVNQDFICPLDPADSTEQSVPFAYLMQIGLVTIFHDFIKGQKVRTVDISWVLTI